MLSVPVSALKTRPCPSAVGVSVTETFFTVTTASAFPERSMKKRENFVESLWTSIPSQVTETASASPMSMRKRGASPAIESDATRTAVCPGASTMSTALPQAICSV